MLSIASFANSKTVSTNSRLTRHCPARRVARNFKRSSPVTSDAVFPHHYFSVRIRQTVWFKDIEARSVVLLGQALLTLKTHVSDSANLTSRSSHGDASRSCPVPRPPVLDPHGKLGPHLE